MLHPIKYVKDIIDLLRNPPGKPLYAACLTEDTIKIWREELDDPEMISHLKVDSSRWSLPRTS